MNEVTVLPEFTSTIDRLEMAKKLMPDGTEYWHAREIMPVMGYSGWDGFEPVIQRAMSTFEGIGRSVPHHFRQTSVMMKVGKGAQRSGIDYFLTRAACYIIAMNGDSSKPEIAAAQAYFAVQARRMEQEDQLSDDEKRLELRKKVTESHKRVSKVAQVAGVRNQMQGVFHDQRFRGLYDDRSGGDVKREKGLTDKDNFFDHAGPLELSAHDFQMNLAADVIHREEIKGVQKTINKNYEVGREVRSAIENSGGTPLEKIPLASEPIKAVKKRLKGKTRKKLTSSNDS